MENWLGQIQIKVDEKGRLALPQPAVSLFPDKELVLSVHVYQKKTYLEVLDLAAWQLKLKSLEGESTTNPKLRAYKRFLLSGSAKLSLDKQNRVTIPNYQREMIGLLKEAVMVNLENKIELWSKANWKETSQNFIEDFEELENWANGEADKEEVSDGLKSVA